MFFLPEFCGGRSSHCRTRRSWSTCRLPLVREPVAACAVLGPNAVCDVLGPAAACGFLFPVASCARSVPLPVASFDLAAAADAFLMISSSQSDPIRSPSRVILIVSILRTSRQVSRKATSPGSGLASRRTEILARLMQQRTVGRWFWIPRRRNSRTISTMMVAERSSSPDFAFVISISVSRS